MSRDDPQARQFRSARYQPRTGHGVLEPPPVLDARRGSGLEAGRIAALDTRASKDGIEDREALGMQWSDTAKSIRLDLAPLVERAQTRSLKQSIETGGFGYLPSAGAHGWDVSPRMSGAIRPIRCAVGPRQGRDDRSCAGRRFGGASSFAARGCLRAHRALQGFARFRVASDDCRY